MSVIENKRPLTRYVHLFFLDGVGLGHDDPQNNPFQQAALPQLNGLFGPDWYLTRTPIQTEQATLVPTDATLRVAGRPQSATGQAAILTGRNIPQLVGEHYGPKPNAPVRELIQQGTLFHEVVGWGGQAALLTPYPAGYFAGIESGKRLLSAVPLAATSAGVRLRTAADLARGDAVSPGFSNEAWRTHLGYTEMPPLSIAEAGERVAQLAARYHFSFFEHWPSDRLGHRGTVAEAARHLEQLDVAIGSLIHHWPAEQGLLIITSDHGNIEEKAHRQHTLNPVPTMIVGKDHARYAQQIATLTDIAVVVRQHLGLPQGAR